MKIFLFILLLFNFFVTILFGIIFFQLPTLKYSSTGCDTDASKSKIKSSLSLYKNLILGLIISLCVIAIFPIFVLVKNILLKVFTGIGGSITKIIISIIEIAILVGLIIFMVIIYININMVSNDPCSDKTKLTDKLNYVYTLVRGLFIISSIITIALIIGIIFIFVRSYINKRKENQGYEESEAEDTEQSEEQNPEPQSQEQVQI